MKLVAIAVHVNEECIAGQRMDVARPGHARGAYLPHYTHQMQEVHHPACRSDVMKQQVAVLRES